MRVQIQSVNLAEFWGTSKYTLFKPFIKITQKIRIICRRSERKGKTKQNKTKLKL